MTNSNLVVDAPNWSALGLLTVLGLPAIARIGHGFGAPDNATKKYGADLARVRAFLQGDRILPAVQSLIEDVSDEARSKQTSIEAVLPGFDYFDRLNQLSSLYRDFNDLDRFFLEIVRWAKVGAAALTVALITFALFMLRIGLHFYRWEDGKAAIVIVGVLALTVTLAAAALEVHARNQLSDLLRRHA